MNRKLRIRNLGANRLRASLRLKLQMQSSTSESSVRALSITCSHALMRQTNKTLQTGSPSVLFINPRKKLHATDFHCDQLRRRDIPFIARQLHMPNTCECSGSDFWRGYGERVHSRIRSLLVHQCVWFNDRFLKEYLIFRYVNCGILPRTLTTFNTERNPCVNVTW